LIGETELFSYRVEVLAVSLAWQRYVSRRVEEEVVEGATEAAAALERPRLAVDLLAGGIEVALVAVAAAEREVEVRVEEERAARGRGGVRPVGASSASSSTSLECGEGTLSLLGALGMPVGGWPVATRRREEGDERERAKRPKSPTARAAGRYPR